MPSIFMICLPACSRSSSDDALIDSGPPYETPPARIAIKNPVSVDSLPVTSPDGKDSGEKPSLPKIAFHEPRDAAKFKLNQPIACNGIVEMTTGVPAAHYVIIENCILVNGKPAVFSNSTMIKNMQPISEGKYRFEALLEGANIPKKPGKYILRAVLVPMMPPKEAKSHIDIRHPPATEVKYEVIE